MERLFKHFISITLFKHFINRRSCSITHNDNFCIKCGNDIDLVTLEGKKPSIGSGIEGVLWNNQIEDNEIETSIVQRRSLMTSRRIKKGEIITEEDIKVVRPCPINAIPPYMKSKIITKKSKRDIDSDSHFLKEDI